MAKVWKKLQRSDAPFTGDVTGTINGASASVIKSGSALGASSNQDSTSTILAGTFTGNVTGNIDGVSAATIKTKAEAGSDAKSAVDGNSAITMVGGSLSIGTIASGVYPFSVDSTGNLKIKNDEFQALADGTVNCKGSFTINQDASSNSKIELAGSSSGTATVLVNGANPTFDLGGATPLGTATLHLKRNLTSNQSRVQFRTGSSGSEFTIGNSNNTGLTTQYAIHTGPLWSSGTVAERALSFDADGKMGMYSNSKTVAGFTFGSDGTNKHVYVKNGGLGVGVANTTDGTLETSGDTTVGGDLDVTGTALTGWHTKDVIWVMPTDFYVNDDQAYYNMALVDSGGALKPMTTSLEAYCNIPIPSGYKVTHFRVNGTASVGIAAYYSDCTTGGQTSCQPPTSIYTNTLYATNPSSGIAANDTSGRYFILKWSCSSTSHQLYGGYLKIAKI